MADNYSNLFRHRQPPVEIRGYTQDELQEDGFDDVYALDDIKQRVRGTLSNEVFDLTSAAMCPKSICAILIAGRSCPYCKVPLGTHNFSLDRMDNAEGHLADNVLLSCGPCNIARSDNFSVDEFVAVCDTVNQMRGNDPVDAPGADTQSLQALFDGLEHRDQIEADALNVASSLMDDVYIRLAKEDWVCTLLDAYEVSQGERLQHVELAFQEIDFPKAADVGINFLPLCYGKEESKNQYIECVCEALNDNVHLNDYCTNHLT